MKRMIPSSKLTIKNDKLTAMEGIYDAEGNQIIADGGSLVVGNPEGTSTATLSKISIQNDGEPVVYSVGGTEVEVNNQSGNPSGALENLIVGNNNYYNPKYTSQKISLEVVHSGVANAVNCASLFTWLSGSDKVHKVMLKVYLDDFEEENTIHQVSYGEVELYDSETPFVQITLTPLFFNGDGSSENKILGLEIGFESDSYTVKAINNDGGFSLLNSLASIKIETIFD